MAFLTEVRIPLNPPTRKDDIDVTLFYFAENSKWSFQDFRSKVKKLPCFSQMPAIRALKNMKNVWHGQLTRLRQNGTEEQKKLPNTLRTSPRKRRAHKMSKGKGRVDDAKAQAKETTKEKRARIKREVSILINKFICTMGSTAQILWRATVACHRQ